MRKNSKPCPKCGQPMHRQSEQCRVCYKKERARPENYVRRECPVCGSEFVVHVVHIKRGQGRYCSKSCARSGSPAKKRDRANVVCHYCGIEFEKHHSEIRKNVGDLHFCSPECWYAHNRNENHCLWEGGQSERQSPEYREWRDAVLQRDKGYCQICHSQDSLEAHHIKRWATHPELRFNVDNGITLCHDCHSKTFKREEEFEHPLSIIRNVELVVWHV